MKRIFVLALVLFVAGFSFAQPKNTVTVDIGPTIIGLAFGAIGSLAESFVDGDAAISSNTGFGIGAQYERQLLEKFSLALRGAYLQGGLGYAGAQDTGVPGFTGDGNFDVNLRSFSAEIHARFYPIGQFFVDGMVGFANMSTTIDGQVKLAGFGQENIDFTATRNFLKVGAKLGLKFDFGSPGGFVFEPSLGYYFPISLGSDPFIDQLDDYTVEKHNQKVDLGDFGDIYEKYVQKMEFAGGPRLSLAFGWRF